MVCVDFSLIDSDPKVSHLLAGIAMPIANEGKCIWQWGEGGGLKNDSVDYSVGKKYSFYLFNFISEKCFDIINLASTIYFF